MYKDVIYVRIDEDLKQKLDAIALEENRSLNNLVVYVLKKYLEEYERNNWHVNGKFTNGKNRQIGNNNFCYSNNNNWINKSNILHSAKI